MKTKPNTFICTLAFQDSNMPKLHQDETCLDFAYNTLRYWLRKYAAILTVDITYPNGDREFYDAKGKYLFTTQQPS